MLEATAFGKEGILKDRRVGSRKGWSIESWDFEVENVVNADDASRLSLKKSMFNAL